MRCEFQRKRPDATIETRMAAIVQWQNAALWQRMSWVRNPLAAPKTFYNWGNSAQAADFVGSVRSDGWIGEVDEACLILCVSPQGDVRWPPSGSVAQPGPVTQPRERLTPSHLEQLPKQFPIRLPAISLKDRMRRKGLLLHRNPPLNLRLSNQAEDAELVQRFPRSREKPAIQVTFPLFVDRGEAKRNIIGICR